MTIRKFFSISFIAFFMAAFSIISATGAESMTGDGPAMIVIPARYSIVQFVFDIARIRPMTIVAFDPNSDPSDPVMHIWDNSLGAWALISISDYTSGLLTDGIPKSLVLVGTDEGMPSGIKNGATWCPKVVEIPSLGFGALANTLNKSMKFKTNEWKWLAERHGLEIKDKNADRRRYGKYGPPNSQAKREKLVTKEGDIDLPATMPATSDNSMASPIIDETPAMAAEDK